MIAEKEPHSVAHYEFCNILPHGFASWDALWDFFCANGFFMYGVTITCHQDSWAAAYPLGFRKVYIYRTYDLLQKARADRRIARTKED
jgi:hypothetical protein